MPKLRLKRTPEEEAARQWRKKQRNRAKTKSSRCSPSSSFNHRQASAAERKWASDDEDISEGYGPGPSSPRPRHRSPPSHSQNRRHKPDYDAIQIELEESRFRERLAEASEDDERLDALEARFNNFVHVPDRWQSSGRGKGLRREFMTEDEFLRLDPMHMDDEEYAEWIRLGMYRRTHPEEYAEQERQKAMKAERRTQEKAMKAETARLEMAAEEERKHKKQEKEARRREYARQAYEIRWKQLLSAPVETPTDRTNMSAEVKLEDIPWPVLIAYPKPDRRNSGPPTTSLSPDDLTIEAISKFLLITTSGSDPQEQDKKARKERLRETYLRFHPDKFEGRLMTRVRERDKAKVREMIGQVVRALNTLMTHEC